MRDAINFTCELTESCESTGVKDLMSLLCRGNFCLKELRIAPKFKRFSLNFPQSTYKFTQFSSNNSISPRIFLIFSANLIQILHPASLVSVFSKQLSKHFSDQLNKSIRVIRCELSIAT